MLRAPAPILLSLFVIACWPAHAKPKFKASEVPGRGAELISCDLDGDGLQDLVLLDDLDLSVFYQDCNQGFARQPQQTYRLERRPCLVWAARLGRPAESLLVMTSEGVSELCFTNRTDPPALRRIIRQRTILPDAAQDTNAMRLTMSAETGRGWPLLLVPVEDGLEVWQYLGEWRRAQFLGHSMNASLRPSLANPGYAKSLGLDFSVGDLNNDGRDDLIIRRSDGERTNTYRIYLQQTNGLFSAEPALTYADKPEPHSWLCWADLNRDGKVDLIKSRWLDEPSFVPGLSSGKVLVRTFMADAQGRIPAQPRQVFRKNDWTPALPVVDVDGDGFPDLVLGYSQMDTREGLRKEFTAKQLDYGLKFYFCRPGAGFPQEADCQRNVVIHLNQADLVLTWGRREYFQHCVSLDGDFSGSGRKDLLVRDHGDRISVYFFVSRERGFSLKPDLQFSCPEQIEEWLVKDLNNDGVSDLIVKLSHNNGYRIFLSRK
jgi:hypothetical protein